MPITSYCSGSYPASTKNSLKSAPVGSPLVVATPSLPSNSTAGLPNGVGSGFGAGSKLSRITYLTVGMSIVQLDVCVSTYLLVLFRVALVLLIKNGESIYHRSKPFQVWRDL